MSRRWLFGTAAAAAGLLAAACGQAPATPAGDTKRQTATPVELRHIPQNSVKDEEAFAGVVEWWHRRQSRVRIATELSGGNVYAKLDTLLAAGTPPDLWWTQASQWLAYVARDAAQDITALVQRDRSFPSDQVFLKVHDEQTRFRGKIYMLPLNTGSFTMYFNKEMFDRAGVRYPTENWTWDDYFKIAERLTTGSGDQKQFGATVASNYKWNVPWTKQIEKEGWDRVVGPSKCLLDDPQIVDAMRWQADLRLRYQYAPMPADNATFRNGRVAMNLNGEWDMWNLRQDARVRWDAMIPPRRKRKATLLFVQGVMVSSATRHLDSVWEWLRVLTTEDAQRLLVDGSGRMPINPTLAQKYFVPYAKEKYGAEHPEVFLKQWEIGTTHFSSDLTSRLEKEALDPGMKQVMEGQIAPTAGMAEITRLANETLKSSKVL